MAILWPSVNACLNVFSAIFLVMGYRAIRQGDKEKHRWSMLGATVFSLLFFLSYLAYHIQVGTVRFPLGGLIRSVYLLILGSHTVLAGVLPFLVPYALYRAFRKEFNAHKRVTRWLFPIWIYVSVTGIIVYVFVYILPKLV